MKKIVTYSILTLGCVFQLGCTADDEGAQSDTIDQTQNMYYNTNSDVQKQRNDRDDDYSHAKNRDELLDGYLTGLDKPDTEKSVYTEGFYNKDSEKISKEINKREEVDLSQVMVLEDQIYIAPMLNQREYTVDTKSILQDIQKQVEEMYPNKKVVVESDGVFWNKMRNLNARIQDADDPQQAREIINDFRNNHQ